MANPEPIPISNFTPSVNVPDDSLVPFIVLIPDKYGPSQPGYENRTITGLLLKNTILTSAVAGAATIQDALIQTASLFRAVQSFAQSSKAKMTVNVIAAQKAFSDIQIALSSYMSQGQFLVRAAQKKALAAAASATAAENSKNEAALIVTYNTRLAERYAQLARKFSKTAQLAGANLTTDQIWLNGSFFG